MFKIVNKWEIRYSKTSHVWQVCCRVNGERKVFEEFASFDSAYNWAMDNNVPQ